MGLPDNSKAFLALVEQAIEAWVWLDEQRVAGLLPLLTSKAQLTAQQLPADNQLEYAHLKHAILQRAGRTPEQDRQCFHALTLEEAGRPFAYRYGQQLQDTCWQWLGQKIMA